MLPMTATLPTMSTILPLRGAAVALLVLMLALAGCASRKPAPVEDRTARPPPSPPAAAAPAAARAAPEPDWRPPTYTVKRGDTLYAIALDHGLDYRELAAWNNIENLNRILVGQVLNLAAPGEVAPAAAGVATTPLRAPPPVVATDGRPSGAGTGAATSAPPPGPAAGAAATTRGSDTLKTQPKIVKEPYSEQALREAQRAAAAPEPPPVVARAEPAPVEPRPAPPAAVPEARPAPADDTEKIDWVWPTAGKVVAGFSETANLKGIDIGGSAGQPVVASAPGKVVYAGTGLRGYGKLIIVKHNATYLSAYAHNREILVKEGQAVARGQKIAEMGDTDANSVKLHFEIRRLGKPMDPLRYLPPA
jgi:lipoprotein NlpD